MSRSSATSAVPAGPSPHVRRGGGRIIGYATTSNGVINASVAAMTENLSGQVARHHILVDCIHPNSTRTPCQTMLPERQVSDVG